MIECALPPSDSSPMTLPAGSPIALAPARTRGGSTVVGPDVGKAPNVLIPALVLPVQLVHPPADSWLRRLCRAILEDALACLEGKGPSSNLGRSDGARRAGQAWQWIASEATYLFSFTLVCAVLNLDVQAVRRQVRQRTLKDKPDHHVDVWAEVEATMAAARKTVARAHAAFDRTRELLHELGESRPLHQAIMEHKAEQLHTFTPQASDSPPESLPAGALSPLKKETDKV